MLKLVQAAKPFILGSRVGFFAIRPISWYPKYALPLLANIAFTHKLMKTALKESEHKLPQEFVQEFGKVLSNIRAIHWNALDEHSDNSYNKGKYLLQSLVHYETKLPQPFRESLTKLAQQDVKSVFDGVRSGIEHLDFQRTVSDLESYRRK